MNKEPPPLPKIPPIQLLCTHCGADANVKPCNCGKVYGWMVGIGVAAFVLEILALLIFGGPPA